MTTFTMSMDPIAEKLTGPGAPFEIVEEEVLGQRLPVFKHRFRSLPEMLLDSGKHGDRELMVDGDRRISYREHLRMVAAVADMLARDYGVAKGDRVAIFAENSIDWDVTFWATVSLGAIAVPMNGWWTQAEFMHGWQLTEPRLLLGDAKRLQRLQGADIEAPILDMAQVLPAVYRREAGSLPQVEIDEDDPALILFTSGTTGRAKGALLSHRTEIGLVQSTRFAHACGMAAWGLSLDDRPPGITLGASPFFHVSGLGGVLLMTLAQGDKVILYNGRFDPERALSLIERERVTLWTILGGMGPKVLSCPRLKDYDLSSVMTIIFGGSPVSESVQQALREVFPNAGANPAIGYGTTETGSVPVGFGGEEFIDHPTSTGSLNVLHQLQIRDESGRALPEGEEGVIWARSAFNMLGYWRNPEATTEVLDAQRWLCTGDIGHMKDGLLYINSRARDMILRSAENIYPTEIEYRLDAHPAVRESAVFGVDDPVHGQAVKAVVVLQEGARVNEQELAQWAGQELAKFKVPEHWEFTTEPLPRNAAGKILKNALMRTRG